MMAESTSEPYICINYKTLEYAIFLFIIKLQNTWNKY